MTELKEKLDDMKNGVAGNNLIMNEMSESNEGMGNSSINNIGFEGSQKIDNNSRNSNNDFEGSITSNSHQSNNDEALPPNWVALEDPNSGETYYANEETGESSWDRPTIPKQILPQSLPEEEAEEEEEERSEENVNSVTDDDGLPPDWIALDDPDSGDTYYLNQITMETTWDRPSKENTNASVATEETDENSQQPSEGTDSPEGTASNEDDLPPGWEAILDPGSGDYYYAHESGETQWDRPGADDGTLTSGGDGTLTSGGDGTFTSNQQSTVASASVNSSSVKTGDTDGLPAGWFAAVDEDSGDTYYCNEKTGVATWDFPTEPAIVNEDDSTSKPDHTPVESPVEDEGDDLPDGWFGVTDPASGDTYYVHDQSGETTWDHPGKGIMNEEFMSSRMSVNETNTVFEDDSVTSSQY